MTESVGSKAARIVLEVAEGIKQEGREEGRVIGQRQVLQRLIESRFGVLETAVHEQLESASPDELICLAERVLIATSLHELFEILERDTSITAADRLMQEGREEGLVIGQQEMLQMLIEWRFGEFGIAELDQLESASPEERTRLAERVLTATSVRELFGS